MAGVQHSRPKLRQLHKANLHLPGVLVVNVLRKTTYSQTKS
jgi:hypothetical protein